MTFDVCYCFPNGDEHIEFAYRFLTSYLQHPPNVDHNTIILTDPGNEANAAEFFQLMPKVRVMATGCAGKDLQRYEEYCAQSSADCAMFLGGSAYCRRGGWGIKAVGAFMNLGATNLYGACGNTGAGPVRPHVRTTGFWCSPALLRQYPIKCRDHPSRYHAEHGSGCISDWFAARGARRWIVTFGGEWDLAQANDDPHGYGGSSRSHHNLLIGDRLTAPPFHSNP